MFEEIQKPFRISWLTGGLLILILLSSWRGMAATGLGLGIVLGEPSGVSVKSQLGDGAFFDGLISYNTGRASTYYLSGGYQISRPALLMAGAQAIDFYYGVGVRVYESEPSRDRKFHLGPQVPVGLSALFNRTKIEAFIELALAMDLIPSTEGDLDGGIGVRYWF